MNKFWIYKSLIEIKKIYAIIRKDKYDKIAAELSNVLLNEWDKVTNSSYLASPMYSRNRISAFAI